MHISFTQAFCGKNLSGCSDAIGDFETAPCYKAVACGLMNKKIFNFYVKVENLKEYKKRLKIISNIFSPRKQECRQSEKWRAI